MWALPGGLVQMRESLDTAAARILEEETGVRGVYLEQLYTFGDPKRDTLGRVVSVAYVALIPSSGIKLRTIDKYADVRWWPFRQLPKLAYDHNSIAAYAKRRLQWKLEYTNVAWSLLPPKFTLTELQEVYEVILGRKIDKRNFRKKILGLKLIHAIGEKTTSGAYRPAMLYRFWSKHPAIIKIL